MFIFVLLTHYPGFKQPCFFSMSLFQKPLHLFYSCNIWSTGTVRKKILFSVGCSILEGQSTDSLGCKNLLCSRTLDTCRDYQCTWYTKVTWSKSTGSIASLKQNAVQSRELLAVKKTYCSNEVFYLPDVVVFPTHFLEVVLLSTPISQARLQYIWTDLLCPLKGWDGTEIRDFVKLSTQK